MDLLVLFTLANHLAIPVLGIIWLGIHNERMEMKRLYLKSIQKNTMNKMRRKFR